VEFVADVGMNIGDCNLINDVPVGVETEVLGYVYVAGDDLSVSVTGGVALCWAKSDYCNPYFEPADLSDQMINCYCPYENVGLYSLQAHRTVANTQYCGSDEEMNERIQRAQANRMFHLCEDWCLYDTENPEKESWFWNPWRKCWHDSTSSVAGAFNFYCQTVYTQLNSIEMLFLKSRRDNFLTCGAESRPTSWVLSDFGASCDDACDSLGFTCNKEPLAQVFTESTLENAFFEVGSMCLGVSLIPFQEWYLDLLLPGLKGSRFCIGWQLTEDHSENFKIDCNLACGPDWQRLCACY